MILANHQLVKIPKKDLLTPMHLSSSKRRKLSQDQTIMGMKASYNSIVKVEPDELGQRKIQREPDTRKTVWFCRLAIENGFGTLVFNFKIQRESYINW